MSWPETGPEIDEAVLSTAYAETLFEIETPDGDVTLRVGTGKAGLPAWIGGRRVAIVTAYNPGAARPGEEANRRANKHLRSAIEANGWSYWPAVGRSPSGDHAEPSFAVLDVTDEQARELGAGFDQACVFYWDGERGRLVWCR